MQFFEAARQLAQVLEPFVYRATLSYETSFDDQQRVQAPLNNLNLSVRGETCWLTARKVICTCSCLTTNLLTGSDGEMSILASGIVACRSHTQHESWFSA